MSIKSFQKIAEQLLQTHYGLSLNDTMLTESHQVAFLIEAGVRPFEFIVEHAQDCGLERIDAIGPFGIGSTADITAGDEDKAIAQIGSLEAESAP
jgi:hypothetical protein